MSFSRHSSTVKYFLCLRLTNEIRVMETHMNLKSSKLNAYVYLVGGRGGYLFIVTASNVTFFLNQLEVARYTEGTSNRAHPI